MTRLLIGGSVLVMLAASAAVYATIPGTDGKVHACYTPPGGPVRVIDADRGQSCRPGETALEWPAALPAAPTCPAGSTLFHRLCFEAPTREGDWGSAVETCADFGLRLPTHTELLAYRTVHLDETEVTEWTDFFLLREAGNAAFVVQDFPGAPLLGIASTTSNGIFYRCVVPL